MGLQGKKCQVYVVWEKGGESWQVLETKVQGVWNIFYENAKSFDNCFSHMTRRRWDAASCIFARISSITVMSVIIISSAIFMIAML